MATYVVLYNLTEQGIKDAKNAPGRIRAAAERLAGQGGKLVGWYATMGQYDAVAKEKETLNGKLQETNTKLEQAQNEIEKTKGAEQEARGQLAEAEESLKKIAGSDSSRAVKTRRTRSIGGRRKSVATSRPSGRWSVRTRCCAPRD